MPRRQDWFSVDPDGLAKILERRGKAFILAELLQNAWDEKCTRVEVKVGRSPETARTVKIEVIDDNPDGFVDLRHAYTLFAESPKKTDPGKRGRFDLGEKLVLAMCDAAQITTTKGTVLFDEAGRHTLRQKTQKGTVFSGVIKMTRDEEQQLADFVRTLISPHQIETTFNGARLEPREPIASIETTLPTEIADTDGVLRRTTRKCTIEIFEPRGGEAPTLYEMGIPIVELDDHWHVNISQKVPLNMERDNVPPSYLRSVRVAVLNMMADKIDKSDATATWVKEAASDERCSDDAITRVMDLRYGNKRVAFDPSDPEANNIAVSRGYTIVHGGMLSGAEWANAKRVGAILPAGRVTPSPKPFSPDGKPLRLLPDAKVTPAMRSVVDYAQRIGEALFNHPIQVIFANDSGWPHAAAYGPSGTLHLNVAKLGYAFFTGERAKIDELLIHEYGHEYEGNHLSHEYHEACCRVGAKMMSLVLTRPNLMRMEDRSK